MAAWRHRQAVCKLVLPGIDGRGVTPLMTEGVAQCRGVTAADTYHAEGVVGGEEEEEKEEEGKR